MRPKVGKVRYINCEPVYYGIEEGAVPATCELVEGSPAELNRMLAEGTLDISVISSLAYGFAPERYRLLPGLAIACDGPVGSVLFLSQVPLKELTGERVRVTPESLTSVALLRLLLEKGHGARPVFVQAEPAEAGQRLTGELLIGDPALKAAAEGTYPYRLDLGEGWKELTGLPFVFALWAVREPFYQSHPVETRGLHRALRLSKAYSLARTAEISRRVHERVGLSRGACLTYLRRQLSFDLSPRHLDGLETFFHMVQAEEALPERIPWRFIE